MPRMCDTIGVWCENCPDDQCLGGDHDVMIGAKPYPKPRDLTEQALEDAIVKVGTDKALAFKPTHFVVPLAALKEQMAKGDALYDPPPKLRAKKGTGTYPGYRDPSTRRGYMKDYMKKRRALKKLLTEPSVLEKA